MNIDMDIVYTNEDLKWDAQKAHFKSALESDPC